MGWRQQERQKEKKEGRKTTVSHHKQKSNQTVKQQCL